MHTAFHRRFRRLPPLVLIVALPASLSACKSVGMPNVPGITPYRMVIQQGNFISQEMVAQLKPGMTREQVRFILGTPLVTDIFHADRWDYVFVRDAQGSKREQRNLSVVFENDKLARVIGDLMPPEGATPQATGFTPQIKPAAEAPKPAAEVPKPAAESAAAVAKPAAEAAPATGGPNWRAASDESEKRPAAADAPKEAPIQEPKKPEATAEEKPAEERGFFGRMLEKIGL